MRARSPRNNADLGTNAKRPCAGRAGTLSIALGGTLNNSRETSPGELPPYLENSLRTAALATLVYLVVCALYIVVSDRWVAALAGGTELHLRLQTFKGIIFVVLSAGLIFGLCALLRRRIARDQRALQAQQQALVAVERRSTAGLLAHSVAHDMNNVLTVGMANVELLRSHGQIDKTGAEMLDDIAISFERLHQMTRRMSHVGRNTVADPAQEADLMVLVRKEAHLMRRHRAAAHCSFAVEGPGSLTLPLHTEAMQDLLQNLLINAAEATQGEGRIEVRVGRTDTEATLEVHDNGPGVPVDRRGQIFEALYTTKPNGLGLGLLSVKAAVKQHNARIEVKDSPLGGACFRVILPPK